MEEVESFENKDGVVLRIYPDTDYDNPRDWCNAWKFCFFHNKYTMPEESGLDLKTSHYTSFDKMIHFVERKLKPALILPVYMYDHSGIGLSLGNGSYPFNCPWDSGMIGFAYIRKRELRKEWGAGDEAKEKAKKYLLGELETYEQYINGSVYGFVKEDADCVELGSCWGFFGYDHVASGLFEHAGWEA